MYRDIILQLSCYLGSFLLTNRFSMRVLRSAYAYRLPLARKQGHVSHLEDLIRTAPKVPVLLPVHPGEPLVLRRDSYFKRMQNTHGLTAC